MLWPTSLAGGKVLLLSDPGNFHATYIRRTLAFCGVPILIAALDTSGAPTLPSKEDMESVVGCIAFDLPPGSVKISEHYPRLPVLFVGSYLGLPVPDFAGWMRAPFASYQVMDRLISLVDAQADDQTGRDD